MFKQKWKSVLLMDETKVLYRQTNKQTKNKTKKKKQNKNKKQNKKQTNKTKIKKKDKNETNIISIPLFRDSRCNKRHSDDQPGRKTEWPQ